MGAATTNDARASSERIRVLRELGSPMGADVAFCAALDSAGGKTRLVVVERVVRGGSVGSQDLASWLENARRLVPLEHPNVARVRDTLDGPIEAYVVSDFVDGARWGDVVAAGSGIPIDVAVRVLLDALGGLGALHNMRDAARQPLGLVHCGVTSDTVLVGLDGVARILGAARMRGLAPATGAHYCAPEVLLEDDAADARADVYSVGVLLWEALMGRRLFTETGISAIVTAVLSGRIPRAEAPPSAPWAAPLVDVAARALSPDPAKRYASAAAMGAELRRIGAAKIVPSLRVAALVRSSFGERIKARREELERGEAGARATSGTGVIAARPSDEPAPTSSAPTPVPPAPLAPTATTRPPPPLGGHAPTAPIHFPPPAAAPSSVRATDPSPSGEPIAVAPIDSIPVALSTSGPPSSSRKPVDNLPIPPAIPVPDFVLAPFPAPPTSTARQANAPVGGSPTAALAAPLVPRELRVEPVRSATAPSKHGTATLAPSILPAVAEWVAQPRNKRIVAIAAAAAALLFVILGITMLVGGKDDAAGAKEAASSEGAEHSQAKGQPGKVVGTSAAAAPSARSPSLPATPTPSPAAPPTPASTPAATLAPLPPAPDTPAETAPAAPPPPAAPPKPKPVIKYDPQGI